ncbi:MAG: YkgJ family cysteine cluster protein [Deferrisomatales bacterium]
MSLCTRCAGTGKTCCQGNDILLTPGDVTRIAAHTGLGDFYEYRSPADPACLGDEGDPNWLAYTLGPDGRRRVLRQRAPQDCFFLGPTGCALGPEARPLVCRLHPFTYTEDTLTGLCRHCPRELLSDGETLLTAVGLEPGEGEAWRRQLYEELRQERVPRGS